MISVDRKQFSRAISLAATCVERRNTIPALTAIKAVANGVLAFEATDLDNHARVEMAYEGKAQSFCINHAQGVRAAVNVAGGASVRLGKTEGRKLRIECGPLDSEVFSTPADDHPGTQRINDELFGCDLGSAELSQIARIMPAISTEETRYYLNGIAVFKVGDWLYRFVATDGHRLMMADVPLPGATGEIPNGTIIPRRWVQIALTSFSRSKEPVRLNYGHASKSNAPEPTLDRTRMPIIGASADLDGLRFTLTGKLIDGTYPDYTRVVPTENKTLLRVKCADLVRAINTLTPMATERTRAVTLDLAPNSLTVRLNSPETGKSNFTIAAEHNAKDDFKIGCNAQYLLDILAALRGDEVELHMHDSSSPVLILDPADTAFRAVQMPMRV